MWKLQGFTKCFELLSQFPAEGTREGNFHTWKSELTFGTGFDLPAVHQPSAGGRGGIPGSSPHILPLSPIPLPPSQLGTALNAL